MSKYDDLREEEVNFNEYWDKNYEDLLQKQ